MSQHNQPPAGAVADLPVGPTVAAAFASVVGQLGLVAQAAKGAIALLVAATLLSLVLPSGGVSNFFLVLASFAATAHFGLNWCRVMLLGPQGLPQHALAWRQAHWQFFGYGLLLFLIMLLSTLPMTALGSLIAAALGLSAASGSAGPQTVIVLLLVFLGMIYVVARFGFVFPAIAAEEGYSLRLAWQHTAGQGGRLMAALFAAGFPLALAQVLLTVLLLEGLLGVSLSDVLPTLPQSDEPATAAEMIDAEPPSTVAVLVFDIVSALFNFLCFAVLFSLLCLAFRTCTGWVPAAGGTLPSVPEQDDGDDTRF